MNIKCSAGKGIMPVGDCLTCALSGENTCGMEYSLLRNIFAAMQHRPDIHVTDLTACLRKSYYEKKMSIPEYPHKMLSRFLGTTFHQQIGNGNRHSEAEMPLEYDGVVGMTDRYYPDQKRLIDYKTTQRIYPQLLPYGSHEVQVNLYAHMLRQQGFDVETLAIQYVSLTGPTSCSKCKINHEWVDGAICCPKCGRTIKNANLGVALIECRVYDDEEVRVVFDFRKGLLEEALKGEAPPIAEPGWLCKRYCPFLDLCPEGMAHVGVEEE